MREEIDRVGSSSDSLTSMDSGFYPILIIAMRRRWAFTSFFWTAWEEKFSVKAKGMTSRGCINAVRCCLVQGLPLFLLEVWVLYPFSPAVVNLPLAVLLEFTYIFGGPFCFNVLEVHVQSS